MSQAKRIRGKELQNAALTPEEGFLWSRLNPAGGEVSELAALCPWEPAEIDLRLEVLVQKNVAEWEVPNEAFAELQPELMRRFDDTNENPYHVLDLYPRASIEEIKTQARELSRKFHPDRFFTKDLGADKRKLEVVFARIQKAYSVLKNPIDREATDQRLSLSEPAQPSSSSEKKMDPELEKVGKAEAHFQAGNAAQKSSDFIKAYEEFAAASKLNPSKQTYNDSRQMVYPEMLKQKVKVTHEKVVAKLKSSAADHDDLKLVEETLRYDARHQGLKLVQARIILDLGMKRRYDEMSAFLQRVKESSLKDPEPCYLLARLALERGEKKPAKKLLQEALKRSPNHSPSTKLLQKI